MLFSSDMIIHLGQKVTFEKTLKAGGTLTLKTKAVETLIKGAEFQIMTLASSHAR